ncbi:MAG TPA: ADOP family duplicated permease [Vicinamibacterales bacterium]
MRRLSAVWRDVLYAVRVLRRSRAFTIVAVIVLALCIGVNTAIFSIINAVVLRPLPVKARHELAFVYSGDTERLPMVSRYVDAIQFGRDSDLFTGVAAARNDSAKLRLGVDVEELSGEQVSANYFDVLGVAPRIGRALVPSIDDAPGASPVVVISDALWRRRFDAEPNAIGRTIVLADRLSSIESARSYTVVGIVGPEFRGLSQSLVPTEYWVSLIQRTEDSAGLSLFTWQTMPVEVVIARMRPGVTREQVQAYATVWGRRVDSADSRGRIYSGQYPRIVLDSRRIFLPFDMQRRVAPSRLGAGLMAVTGFMLVIGVANLAGLMMARGVVRRGEVAVRLTLGASRWRLARQLLAEGMLLAALGGMAGLVASRWFVAVLLDNMPASVSGVAGFAREVALGVPLDSRVVGFTMLLCVGIGLVVGLAPVRQASRTDLLTMLSGASVAGSRQVRSRLRHWVVIPQVCLSLALLLAAGVAVRALTKVALVPPGYEPEHAAFATLDPGVSIGAQSTHEQRAQEQAAHEALHRRLLELLESSPEIEAAALTDGIPARPTSVRVIGQEDFLRGDGPRMAYGARVTPGFFRALGIPFLQGRGFEAGDERGTPRVAIIDEAFAAQQWPGQNPIGRQLALSGGPSMSPAGVPGPPKPPDWLEVVGVVGAVQTPLSEGAPRPFVYLPRAGQSSLLREVIIARGRIDNVKLIETLRRTVAQADPRAGIMQARMMTAAIDEMRYPRRIAASLLGFAGLVGLILASIGLYGVVSYSVAQRVRELGIRAALGADRTDLTWLVVKEGGAAAAVGIALGFILGYLAIRITSNQVIPIPRADVTTLVAAPVLLGIVILLASYLPARRAARVDPMDVLRNL